MIDTLLRKIWHDRHSLDAIQQGTVAFGSLADDVETAIVFIHGFHGDAIKTWSDFTGIMEEQQHLFHWSNADLYFFTYKDHTASIDCSSTVLAKFLEQIYPEPCELISEAMGRSKSATRYRRLVLVGHSEGAIVLRATLVEYGKALVRDGVTSALLTARVVLFAPAMMGVMPTKMLGAMASISSIRKLIDIWVAHSTPASEMQDGRVLKQVQDDTERLYKSFPHLSSFAAHVIFGEREDVVVQSRYFYDKKYPAAPGTNHTTVCKPTPAYQLPLNMVVGG